MKSDEVPNWDRRAFAAVLLVAVLALAAAILTSPRQYVHDELNYVLYVHLLKDFGLTEQFLDALPGAAGPLYGFLHLIFEPLTGLSPVWMRWVNAVLLVGVIAILAAWFRRTKCADYPLAAGSILVVPLTWLMTGVALTSLPMLVFVTLSIYLQFRGLDALARGGPVVGWFGASAVALGVAVWGRQPAVVLVVVPVVLAMLDRRLRLPAVLFVGIVAAFLVPLVIAWDGLVPPDEEIEAGFSPGHGLLSLGYAAVYFFLLVPRLEWPLLKPLVVAAPVIVAANVWLDMPVVYPFRTFVESFLSTTGMKIYGTTFTSLLMTAGAAFFGLVVRALWRSRGDLQQVAIHTGLLCCMLSPVFIANYFSSRYAALALPYLVLAAQPRRIWGWKTILAAAAGCAMGLLSLVGHYWIYY